MPSSRVRDIEWMLLKSTLGAAAKGGAIAVAVWLAAGAVALLGIANREAFAAWPEVVKYLLFALVTLTTGPILLLGAGVTWVAKAAIGTDLETAVERGPLVVAAVLLVIGVVIAKRTSSRIFGEAIESDLKRIENARRSAVADPKQVREPDFVESLSARPDAANKARSEAFIQVINHWLIIALVGYALVAAAMLLAQDLLDAA